MGGHTWKKKFRDHLKEKENQGSNYKFGKNISIHKLKKFSKKLRYKIFYF